MIILSPSGKIDSALIDAASQRLRDWGFRVKEGAHARSEYGRFAGTAEERTQDLVTAFADTDNDYILCTRGGYGLQQIIDRLPINQGGVIIGFSDVTELHCLMALQGKKSLHASMCKALAELPENDDSIGIFRDALQGKNICYTLSSHPLNRQGQTQGKVIGGNLSVLYGLQGTPFALTKILDLHEQQGQKTILFIEDIAENHYHIDRMMNNLRMSGVLARLNGLIVGQFSDTTDDPSMGCTIYETILHAVQDYAYPVLFDFPAGHTPVNYPLWLNTPAELAVSPSVSTLSFDA